MIASKFKRRCAPPVVREGKGIAAEHGLWSEISARALVLFMKNIKILLVSSFIILLVVYILNNPFDTEGVIRATIGSTVSSSQGQTIIVSSNVIGSRKDMAIHGNIVRFIDKSDIREMAELQISVLYHEFTEFRFVLIGYKVAIDHLTMYPANSTQICYSCNGDFGLVSFKNNEWSYRSIGGWLS